MSIIARSLVRRALVPAVLFAACVAPVGAQTVPAPPGSGGNCLVFGCTDAWRYQQVYAATSFGTAPISITGLTFFNTVLDVPSEDARLTLGTYTISLGTTTRAVGALDGSDMNSNRGPNFTTFATFVVSGPASTAPSFTIVGAPFLFDPALGNLLLEVNAAYAEDRPNDGRAAYLDRRVGSPESSRAFCDAQGCNTGVTDDRAFITRFEIGPQQIVPEPGTYALLAAGLVGLGVGVRSRRRASRG